MEMFDKYMKYESGFKEYLSWFQWYKNYKYSTCITKVILNLCIMIIFNCLLKSKFYQIVILKSLLFLIFSIIIFFFQLLSYISFDELAYVAFINLD